MDTEVLIVGAGPTGLMLANQLGRRGVCAMIIDHHSGPAQQSRDGGASAHARNLFEDGYRAARALARCPGNQGQLNVYLWEDGFQLLFRIRDKNRWRVIGILPAAMRARDDLTFDEVVPAIRREAGANLTFKQCSWFSIYRIHHRAAGKFRDRR